MSFENFTELCEGNSRVCVRILVCHGCTIFPPTASSGIFIDSHYWILKRIVFLTVRRVNLTHIEGVNFSVLLLFETFLSTCSPLLENCLHGFFMLFFESNDNVSNSEGCTTFISKKIDPGVSGVVVDEFYLYNIFFVE